MLTNWYFLEIDIHYYIFLTITLAIILDLAIGDPEVSFHPVRLIGNSISLIESVLFKIGLNGYIGGFILFFSVVSIWIFLVSIILYWSSANSTLFTAVSGILVYFSLSIRCLADEARGIIKALNEHGLEAGRKRLSRIVSRDTKEMNHTQIYKSTIESISENFVDSVASPIFYTLLFGPLGAFTYRIVNTLDAMVGYKNKKYLKFGFFSAKMDDLLNYIPARLSFFVIYLAGCLMGRTLPLKKIISSYKESRYHESPNSGIPESVFSYLLNVRLGGTSYYGGMPKHREIINSLGQDPDELHVKEAIKLLYYSSLLYYILSSTYLLAKGLSI